jgi:hypothetical protein
MQPGSWDNDLIHGTEQLQPGDALDASAFLGRSFILGLYMRK